MNQGAQQQYMLAAQRHLWQSCCNLAKAAHLTPALNICIIRILPSRRQVSIYSVSEDRGEQAVGSRKIKIRISNEGPARYCPDMPLKKIPPRLSHYLQGFPDCLGP